MKKIYFVLIVLICFPLFIYSQTSGTIKGVVYDNSTKATLPGANVWVEVGGQLIGSATDDNGSFTIKPLNPGKYNLHISYSGRKEVVLTLVVVNPDKITFVNDTYLEDKACESDSLFVVKAYRIPLIDPEDPIKVTVLANEIELLPESRNVNRILNMISSDIQVSEDGEEVYFRGSRNGSVAYFVDGIRQLGTNPSLPGGCISSMTVYTGAVPAKYGDFVGGVVVIETKSYFDFENERKAKELNK